MDLPLISQMIFFGAFVLSSFLLIQNPQRFRAIGVDPDDPFYPWKRWSWESLPSKWKSKLRQSVFWCVTFTLLTTYLLAKQRGWVYPCTSSLLSLNFAVTSARIIAKVKVFQRQSDSDLPWQ